MAFSHRVIGTKPNRLRLFAGISTFVVGLCLYGHFSLAEPTTPSTNDRYIAKMVHGFLQNEHQSKHPVDDEMSERCFNQFLKGLDARKLYFLQEDIDEFAKNKTELDNMIAKGDVSFATKVFQRFLQRIDERVKFAEAVLKEDLDFTQDEEMNTDFKKLDYAKSTKELDERWRKQVKYDLLDQKFDKVAPEEAKIKLNRRYSGMSKRMHRFTNDNLLELYLSSMTTSFDPHTTYMSATTEKNFRILMSLNLEGIGASLQYDDGYTKVAKIIAGGAADKDGRLKVNDRVIAVGQDEDGEMVDVVDMNLDEVVKLIRGKPNTVVRLRVQPGGTGEARDYKITRAKIELTDGAARGEIIEDGKKPNGQPFKVGVINLPSFYMDMKGAQARTDDYRSTTRDVKRILDDFTSKNVDVVVMDLRKNGGGSLPEAVSVTGLFVDEGPIVQIKDSDGTVNHLDDPDKGVAWKGPLVVMISKLSASASEIFAGAIQDYNRGIIVGDKTTHGKGTVQTVVDLSQQFFRIGNVAELGALKITMSQFYRPNGDSTQNRGVVADVELPAITTHMDIGESDLEFALPFDKVEPVAYRKENTVTPKMIEELRASSKARIAESADFKKVEERIENYKIIKEKKRISLNEEKFFAERKKMNLDKEEEKELEEESSTTEPIVKRDFYFNETLAIAIDLISMTNRLASK